MFLHKSQKRNDLSSKDMATMYLNWVSVYKVISVQAPTVQIYLKYVLFLIERLGLSGMGLNDLINVNLSDRDHP
jgi:hypothetical protein